MLGMYTEMILKSKRIRLNKNQQETIHEDRILHRNSSREIFFPSNLLPAVDHQFQVRQQLQAPSSDTDDVGDGYGDKPALHAPDSSALL
jgi:hypothetical protein